MQQNQQQQQQQQSNPTKIWRYFQKKNTQKIAFCLQKFPQIRYTISDSNAGSVVQKEFPQKEETQGGIHNPALQMSYKPCAPLDSQHKPMKSCWIKEGPPHQKKLE
mmetsp:Transcript_36093/g.58161  ORF Transcript_36093/g.58161 Transcript_36093/m.58161 type:complete len:106 (+) Transcript_36093:245-562(+)